MRCPNDLLWVFERMHQVPLRLKKLGTLLDRSTNCWILKDSHDGTEEFTRTAASLVAKRIFYL